MKNPWFLPSATITNAVWSHYHRQSFPVIRNQPWEFRIKISTFFWQSEFIIRLIHLSHDFGNTLCLTLHTRPLSHPILTNSSFCVNECLAMLAPQLSLSRISPQRLTIVLQQFGFFFSFRIFYPQSVDVNKLNIVCNDTTENNASYPKAINTLDRTLEVFAETLDSANPQLNSSALFAS